jgi:hypothetical protein
VRGCTTTAVTPRFYARIAHPSRTDRGSYGKKGGPEGQLASDPFQMARGVRFPRRRAFL